MKKSLSTISAVTLLASMFSSVAFAAEAPKTTQEKFDALKALGIFEGVNPQGDAGLDQSMTRAQVAKILVKLMGLKEDESGATGYTDLTVETWAKGFIGAATKAGLMEGTGEGTFDPGATFTAEELATVLDRALGLKVSSDAVDGTVSDWAKGYVAAALKAGLIDKAADYTQPALRELLVNATFAAYNQLNVPTKVSVADAKATGVQQVTVTFNATVDTAKATLTLKKGTSTLATTAKFADDKKSAVLTLTDAKINAGDYTVTLGGLDASAIDVATAKFTAQDETVSKIEFVSSSDTVAYSKNVSIALKATNQYGEVASKGASAYTAFVNGQTTTLTGSDGNLTVKTNTTLTGYVQGQSIIPVTVYFNDTRVTATKNFKLGTAPFLSNVTLGNVTYSNGGTSLSAVGDTAKIAANFADQYGNPINADQVNSDEVKKSVVNAVVAPYSSNVSYDSSADLFDTDGNGQIIIKLTGKEDKTQDYTVTVYAGASVANAKVTVGASKLATKVAFGSFDGHVAAGDTKDFYIPIVAYDANGVQLTAQEIADNAKANRFTFSGSNVVDGSVAIEQYGENKGKLKFNLKSGTPARSTVYLTALIATTNANSYTQTSISVEEQRHPERLALDNDAAAKYIGTSTSDFKVLVKDQYGDDFDVATATSIPNANGENSDYRVVTTISGDAGSGLSIADTHGVTLNDSLKTYTYTDLSLFNDGYNVNSTDGKMGKITFKAVIQKKTATSDWGDYSSTFSRTYEAIKPDADLTYSLSDLGTTYSFIDSKPGGISGDDLTAGKSFFKKTLDVVAKDSSGNEVAIPNEGVRGVSSSNSAVAQVAYNDVNDGYVLGNTAGTATVTAVVYTNKGTTVVLTKDITVKSDLITVASISTDNTTATYNFSAPAADVSALFNQLVVKDQYGTEYDSNDGEIAKYDSILGIRYSVSDISGGAVSVDAKSGALSVGAGVKEFVVTATAPNGKSVQVLVTTK